MSPKEQTLLERLFGEGVAECNEAGLRLITLPIITMPLGCRPQSAMGIYVPQPFQGYASRLFLESAIVLASGVAPATTTTVLLGRTMFAASIRDVPGNLPLHQGVLAHLRRYEAAA